MRCFIVGVGLLFVGSPVWSAQAKDKAEQAKEDAAKAQIGVLETAVLAYKVKFDEFPPNLDTLTEGTPPFVKIDALRDPWGKNYQYDLTGAKNGGKKPDIWTETPGKKTIGNFPAKKEKGDKKFQLSLRSQAESKGEGPAFRAVLKQEEWTPSATAIIVCDMWDAHHCLNAVRRAEEMAPRMNEVLEKGRGQGALIIHAPSSCMDAYKDHPARKRAQAARRASNLPKDIGEWCHKIPAEEKGKYPIDQSDGGEDDDLKEHEAWHAKLKAMGRNPKAPWQSQVAALKIHNEDAISDSGVEVWNLLEERGIKNIILVGVHTNMCVLGRPFGLRQLAKNGKHVVLMRDMTDTMYNPKMPPHVAHYRGTDLIVEHIEKYVCPTVTSDQIVGGKPFRFKADDGK